jgi:hypothetical protein
MASKGSSIYDIFSTTPFDFDWTNRLSAQLPDAPEWVWWSFVLEAFLIVFGGFWSVLFMIIIIKYPLFHKNLHFLIGCFKFMTFENHPINFSNNTFCIVDNANEPFYYLSRSDIYRQGDFKYVSHNYKLNHITNFRKSVRIFSKASVYVL